MLTFEMHNYALTDEKNLRESHRLEKYSLRQRQQRIKKALAKSIEESLEYASDNSYSDQDIKTSPTPAAKRSEGRRQTKSTSNASNSKSKTKAAPLSKYRRKTANARERTRMREINSAFENLRQCVPQTITGEDAGPTNEKLTKITTLRLAMKYIGILTDMLEDPDFKDDFLLECKRDGDLRFTAFHNPLPMLPVIEDGSFENSSNETTTSDESSPTPMASAPRGRQYNPKAKNLKSTTAKKPAKKDDNASTTTTTSTMMMSTTRKAPPKRQLKKQKRQQAAEPLPPTSSTMVPRHSAKAPHSSPNSTTTSAYASLSSSTSSPSTYSDVASTISNSSSSYLLDSCLNSSSSAAYIISSKLISQSMSDLSSLMLESDADSLHLSEHCRSPLQDDGHHFLSNAAMCDPVDTLLSCDTFTSSLENPLELSLRLLESSSADSLEFVMSDQQPPSCISPLVTLDSCHPFGDLLHPDLFLT